MPSSLSFKVSNVIVVLLSFTDFVSVEFSLPMDVKCFMSTTPATMAIRASSRGFIAGDHDGTIYLIQIAVAAAGSRL